VLPLAHLMGEATEHLAEKTGPTIGGLLNATFGNAAEIIIAVIALSKGLNEIVQASLTGSILGNLLLVGGAAMLAGGWRRESQSFNAHAAENNAGLLVLGVGALLFPAIFHHAAVQLQDKNLATDEWRVSMLTSFVLLAVYALGLLFTLRTHAHIFSRKPHEEPAGRRSAAVSRSRRTPALRAGRWRAGTRGTPPLGTMFGVRGRGHADVAAWSTKKSVVMLLLASVGIGIVAELLVGSAEKVAHDFGWNEIFVGVILLAIIGNAAEHSTAILMAMKDDMDTAMTITYQSSLQIALFAVPFLVLLSGVMASAGIGQARHMTLMFSPMEVIAVVITVFIVVVLGMNGRTNWFEGVMLLAVYAVLGIAFFYIPSGKHGGYDSGAAATQPAAAQPAAAVAPK
jgi:Ca2+:H+ antiporter